MNQSNLTRMHQLASLAALSIIVSCQVDQTPVKDLYTFSKEVELEVIRSQEEISIEYLNSTSPQMSDLIQFKDYNWTNSSTLHCIDKELNFDNYFEFLSDELLLWRINKIYGEIDEVYLGYLNQEDITQSKQSTLSAYCDRNEQIPFHIPADYSGLVFVIQDQPENSMSFKPEGIVIQSTRKLDLKSYICNKYILSTEEGELTTSIQENLGLKTDPKLVRVENWGFNSGPYHDILASTGFKGEVMVFKVHTIERP